MTFPDDSIPIHAFGNHIENVFDKNTGAFESHLAVADIRINNEILANFPAAVVGFNRDTAWQLLGKFALSLG
jgi:hypothetical protein